MRTITIGVDLAKQVFSVCSVDAAGRIQERRDLRREAFIQWLPRVPEGTVVAMEACSGAHHWARRCQDHGLQPRLIAAQFVAPFRKSRTSKNDRNDAEAIATAARQGNMRFVPVKTVDQQVRLSWHRVREGYKAEALATSNRMRGLLAEVGVVVAQSDAALRRALADLDSLPIPSSLLELLHDVDAHRQQLRERIAQCDLHIQSHAKADEAWRAAPGHHRGRTDHSGRRGGDGRLGTGLQEWPAVRRVAGAGADAAFQWWPFTTWPHQLPWRWLFANPVDPRGTQQPAAGQGGGLGEGDAGATLDPGLGTTTAIRQAAGCHCQQARAAAMGDAGTW